MSPIAPTKKAAAQRSILQVVAPGEVGGLESVVLALASGLAGRGHDVNVGVVYAPRDGEHPFVAALKKEGVRAVPFAVPARAYWKERALIRDWCDREKPEVVHTHGYRPDILHAATRLKRDFATVTTVHGSSRVGGSSTIHEMLQTLLLRRFDAVIAVSRPLSEQLRGKWVSSERLHVVPNAWSDRITPATSGEARQRLGLPSRGILVGWIGRLIPIKGADVFLRAVRELASEPLNFSLIGDGSERHRLEDFVRSQGLSDRVRFHGTIPEAARYMSAFDVFVLSSRSEGTPVTLLEAMAARVPIVATAVGGVPDVVGPNEALLVAPEDPSGIADAIRSVIGDRNAAACRAESAVTRLHTKFDKRRWIDAHENIYNSAISDRMSA